MMYRPTLAAVAMAAHKLAQEKGHYSPPRPVSSYLMHLAGEVREAAAAYHSESADRFAEELADVVLLALSIGGFCGLDMEQAILKKHEKNKLRPWKHGKGA